MSAAGLQQSPQPLLIGAGVMVAVALRSAVAGGAAATSSGAGVVFAAALLALALAAGWRPGRPSATAVALGMVGAAVLIVAPMIRGGLPRSSEPPLQVLSVWAPAVCLVAAAEEVILRGVLYSAVEARAGAVAALLLTAVIFALIHLPLYGPSALPLDLAVGVWLGTLRWLSGGVLAPALAHAIADLGSAWIV